MSAAQVYVSLTGLRLKSSRHTLRFWWHAIRSMMQARRAPGNISTDARIIEGVHHTVSVWTDQEAMRRFLVAGAHLQAMKAFGSIATGQTLGFYAESAPPWNEVHAMLETSGRTVGASRA